MRKREDRHAVALAARLSEGAAWNDVVIRNISRHGLMLETPQPLRRGAYVELRRGTARVIARVIWAASGQCGLRSQDPLDPHVLTASRPCQGETDADRRMRPRVNDVQASHAAAGRFAAAAQFAVFVLLAVLAAWFALGEIGHVLGDPLHRVVAVLQR